MKILFNLKMSVLYLLALLAFSGCSDSSKDNVLRIGWQTVWATQGQLALIMQKTDILTKQGLEGKFTPFQYGAPMAEAAVANGLDIAFLGDQPAISLMARSKDWEPIARLMNFRVALLVPMNSDITDISQLKGKKIGVPIGSSAHRELLAILHAHGVQTKDVKLTNIDIVEQGEILKAVHSNQASDFSAFAAWDPHIEQFEQQGLINILAEANALGVVMMRKAVMQEMPEVKEKFLAAFKDTHWFYSQNRSTADTWFADQLGNHIDKTLLFNIADNEPNLKVKNFTDISVKLSEKELHILQQASNFAYTNKLIQKKPHLPNTES